jgi:Protein of unknown function (DUF4019)
MRHRRTIVRGLHQEDLMKRSSYLLLILCLALVTVAFPQANTKAAEAAAAQWLKLVDSGNYPQSWQQTSSSFQSAISKREWEQKLRAVRTPLGAMVSRKLQSAQYETQLPGAPDGQYVVIRYDTSFQHKKAAIETLVSARDKSGQWRVSGYFIQ